MNDNLRNSAPPNAGLSTIEKTGLILFIIINIPLLWMAIGASDYMGWGMLIIVDSIPLCIIVSSALSKNRNSAPATGLQITAKTILNIICRHN